jgi:hypothetical protein
MTKSEAEDIFFRAIAADESILVEMTPSEVKVFRVLIGRMMGQMETKNRPLWQKAREFGIEYKQPYAIIKKTVAQRPMFRVVDGEIVEITTDKEEEIKDDTIL